MIFMAMMLAGAEPSAEALALGRRISERGTLATLLTVGEKKDGMELAARNPGMSEADTAALAETTRRIYAEAREQFLTADAKSLATQLSIEDLRALDAFAATPAAQHLHDKMPAIIIGTLSQIGKIELGATIRADYCKGREKQPLCAN
jgi:hypothetical protein